jgi:hypothetical protein
MADGRIRLRAIFDAARGAELTDAELRAWLVIRSYEGPSGGCAAGQDTLAAHLDRTTRQFRRLKRSLIKKGWLENHWRGSGTPLLHTRLPDDTTGRTPGVPPREDIREDTRRPPKVSREDAREDAREDVREDAQRPTSIGVKEYGRGGTPLGNNILYAVIRKVIADGTCYRFDTYRTDPDFLPKRAQAYGMPDSELRAMYADAERLRYEPKQQDMVEEMHRLARQRMDGAG